MNVVCGCLPILMTHVCLQIREPRGKFFLFIKPAVQDSRCEPVAEVIYPDDRKKVFWDSWFCAGKESLKFPLYLLGGIGAAIRCGEEICAFRKCGIPDSGIIPCKGKHILRHYDGSAFPPFCFNDPYFSAV